MTGESGSTSSGASSGASGRPPPTIELTATEVEQPSAAKAERTAYGDPEKPESSSAQAESQDASEPRATPSGRGPLLGHIISAVIGAVAAAAILVGLWLFGFTFAHDVINSQVATQDTGSNAANAEISARLGKIERALQAPKLDTANVPPALGNRLSAVETQTKMLSDSAAALNHRIDEIATTAQTAQKQAATSAASAEDAAKNAGQAGAQRDNLDTLTTRIAALESAVKELTEKTAHPTIGIDQAVRLSVAAQALRTAVEAGVPYQSELKAVQSLRAPSSATAPLEPFAATGLPPAETLARELAALVPVLRAAANPSSGDATLLDKLKANAQKLVHITPVDAPPGNDPTSVITRIDIDANRADIGAALKDIAALPGPLKSLAADWAKTAQAREGALAASRNISADALAALSKPAPQ